MLPSISGANAYIADTKKLKVKSLVLELFKGTPIDVYGVQCSCGSYSRWLGAGMLQNRRNPEKEPNTQIFGSWIKADGSRPAYYEELMKNCNEHKACAYERPSSPTNFSGFENVMTVDGTEQVLKAGPTWTLQAVGSSVRECLHMNLLIIHHALIGDNWKVDALHRYVTKMIPRKDGGEPWPDCMQITVAPRGDSDAQEVVDLQQFMKASPGMLLWDGSAAHAKTLPSDWPPHYTWQASTPEDAQAKMQQLQQNILWDLVHSRNATPKSPSFGPSPGVASSTHSLAAVAAQLQLQHSPAGAKMSPPTPSVPTSPALQQSPSKTCSPVLSGDTYATDCKNEMLSTALPERAAGHTALPAAPTALPASTLLQAPDAKMLAKAAVMTYNIHYKLWADKATQETDLNYSALRERADQLLDEDKLYVLTSAKAAKLTMAKIIPCMQEALEDSAAQIAFTPQLLMTVRAIIQDMMNARLCGLAQELFTTTLLATELGGVSNKWMELCPMDMQALSLHVTEPTRSNYRQSIYYKCKENIQASTGQSAAKMLSAESIISFVQEANTVTSKLISDMKGQVTAQIAAEDYVAALATKNHIKKLESSIVEHRYVDMTDDQMADHCVERVSTLCDLGVQEAEALKNKLKTLLATVGYTLPVHVDKKRRLS